MQERFHSQEEPHDEQQHLTERRVIKIPSRFLLCAFSFFRKNIHFYRPVASDEKCKWRAFCGRS